ncbi:MAG: aminopeptidase P family protein [Nitrospirae bacterium]|nr:aminopeptidase P family protein [Nitrospirota bacterium]
MKRTEALKSSFPELGIKGILVTDPANIRYLSGFTGSSGCVIITQSKSLFVTDFRYSEQAEKEVEKGFRIHIENDVREKVIADLCVKHRVSRLGFEANHATYAFLGRLRRRKVRLKPLIDTVEDLREIKSAEELTYIRKAVKRAERAFLRVKPYIKTGEREINISQRLEGYLREEGCRKLPFEAIVASGPLSAMPHARPTGRRLRRGDLVVIDWGGECEGYFSDMTRTLIMDGGKNDYKKKIYSIVLDAQKKAISASLPLVKASSVDYAARNCIKMEGFGEHFGHAAGHGIGLAIHEKPIVSWRSKDTLKNGMVFTVEPGIYIPGLGGVRIEDMVYIGEKKAHLLGSLPKNLK